MLTRHSRNKLEDAKKMFPDYLKGVDSIPYDREILFATRDLLREGVDEEERLEDIQLMLGAIPYKYIKESLINAYLEMFEDRDCDQTTEDFLNEVKMDLIGISDEIYLIVQSKLKYL